jgi:Sulfotransferase family
VRPNFFILGAPKCGTTSLSAWLKGHPEIFIPETKEPHFFNTDDKRATNTLQEYDTLFASAADRHKRLGEASVWYLSSSDAVPNILKCHPEAHFIAMVRNPVEMAPALHAEMVISGHENVRDFEVAWRLQEKRKTGECLPPFTWARRRLLYGEVCKLGSQIERLFSVVPRERVLVICLDEMACAPRSVYLNVLKFLEIDDDGRTHFPVYNRARRLRWPRVSRWLFVLLELKSRLGIQFNWNVWRRFEEASVVESGRAGLSPEMTTALEEYFAADVAHLGNLIGKNLSGWVNSPDVESVRSPLCSERELHSRDGH